MIGCSRNVRKSADSCRGAGILHFWCLGFLGEVQHSSSKPGRTRLGGPGFGLQELFLSTSGALRLGGELGIWLEVLIGM